MNMTLELDLVVEGTASPGRPGSWHEPPEPPEVEIQHVWLEGWIGWGRNTEKKRIDIVEVLSASDMEIVEEAFLEDLGDIEPESQYDTTYERDMDRD